jgi:hypothetical protein
VRACASPEKIACNNSQIAKFRVTLLRKIHFPKCPIVIIHKFYFVNKLRNRELFRTPTKPLQSIIWIGKPAPAIQSPNLLTFWGAQELIPSLAESIPELHKHFQSTGSVLVKSWKTDATFYYCWEIKSSFKLVWMEYRPIQLTDWPPVEVALMLIGLISLLTKTSFETLGRDQSSFRLPCSGRVQTLPWWPGEGRG